ncbi:saccharopine dehydrogenase family protein [Spirillospora sp. NPDC048823]|uniref:saccharopine dehydrogenase family protein n=1 Tax=unclassified Spirillospora TaxID=2642701 RepID=UPI003720731C
MAAPIVVYGMSGYTGRMIAEYLTRNRLPFIAAGRDEQRLKDALDRVPGEHDAQVCAVRHDEAALTELFSGARIVVNVVGPFGQLAEPVVRAALAAGCHYIDTTGEQDYATDMRDRYGPSFADRDLVFVSACAFMWTAGMIAAELALETPGIDSLDILYAPKSMPTVASTLSFLRMCCLPQHYKQDGALLEWPAGTAVDVTVPGRHAVHTGLPWGGGFEPLWFREDTRVRNCQVLVALPKSPLVDFIRDRVAAYQDLAQTKSREELEEVTNEWAMFVASEPPREVPEVNHVTISCWARGATVGRHVLLHTTSPYLQTGALIAESCRRILDGRLRAVGFQPATAAFGHRELMAALAEHGLHG